MKNSIALLLILNTFTVYHTHAQPKDLSALVKQINFDNHHIDTNFSTAFLIEIEFNPSQEKIESVQIRCNPNYVCPENSSKRIRQMMIEAERMMPTWKKFKSGSLHSNITFCIPVVAQHELVRGISPLTTVALWEAVLEPLYKRINLNTASHFLLETILIYTGTTKDG